MAQWPPQHHTVSPHQMTRPNHHNRDNRAWDAVVCCFISTSITHTNDYFLDYTYRHNHHLDGPMAIPTPRHVITITIPIMTTGLETWTRLEPRYVFYYCTNDYLLVYVFNCNHNHQLWPNGHPQHQGSRCFYVSSPGTMLLNLKLLLASTTHSIPCYIVVYSRNCKLWKNFPPSLSQASCLNCELC